MHTTKQTHTPGPWTSQTEDKRFLAADGAYLVSTGAPLWKWVAEVHIPLHNIPWTIEEAQANARLIAAAPELYHQLVWAHRMLLQSGWRNDDDGMEEILAAIAKAEGVEP